MDASLTSPVLSEAAPPPSASSPVYRDRSTGLVIFGIIQIILGLFAALFVPFTLLSVFIARKMPMGAMPAGYYVLSISTYAAAAVVLIMLGIGSIRAQRWGRDLTLISAWLWLVYGAVTLIMMTAVLPSSLLAGFKAAAATNPQSPALPAGFMAVIATLMIAFMAVFMVILPIIFVVFYRKNDVKETCLHRDPKPRWTERVPLPLLAASAVFTIGVVYYVLLSFTMPIAPFFGRYLTGFAGAGLCLVMAALDALVAVLFFRKQVAGLWIAVAAVVVRMASIGFTFRRGNLSEAYARMGWSSAQLQLMENNAMYRSGGFLLFGLFFLVILLVYLLWLRRFFAVAETAQVAAPDIYQNPSLR